MATNHNLGGNYWGYLINKDKSPAPLLDQLCLALAKYISTELEPKGVPELTPQKLASFYRAVGGNYDPLFLQTANSSLSFIYQQLGCFHSLQPTENAFEAPCVPALLPCGFVRWQTIQILLDPDENCKYLQEALQRFDLPNTGGGIAFPKIIPREAFPPVPDKDMVKWHNIVGERMQQESRQWRLKNSPHHSPYERSGSLNRVSSNDDRMVDSSDYFSRTSARPSSSRTTRPHRADSHDPRYPQGRRPSAPDIDLVSPTTRTDPHYNQWPPSTSQRHQHSPRRDSSGQQHRHTSHSSSRGQSPRRRDSSGSDASSEADSPHAQRKSTTWNHVHLYPPHAHLHHTRRHSHDATYSNTANPPLPSRHRDRKQTYAAAPSSYPPQPRQASGVANPRNVQFRDSFADQNLSDPGNSSSTAAPMYKPRTNPIQAPGAPPLARRWVKSADPINANIKDRDKNHRSRRDDRVFGSPMRVNTVTGVGGRRYADTPNPTSAGSTIPENWRGDKARVL